MRCKYLCAAIALVCTLSVPAAARQDAAWDVTVRHGPGRDVTFTLSEGTWMGLDVSPDGGTIYFDLLGDIFALPAKGGEARVIHDGAAMQRSPRVSPDGRKLLYLSDADGADNLWVSDLNGKSARQISRESVDALTGPAWGARGATVAAGRLFGDVAHLHASQIVQYAITGGPGKVLVDAPANGENVHEAAFSPDGRFVYYTEKITPQSASVVYIDANHINYAIMRRDLKSGETTQLIAGFGGATTPQISPDGKRLAFIRRVRDKTVLFRYDIATGEQTPIYDALDRDGQADFIGQGLYYPPFDWFPDNRSVAVWAGGKIRRVNMETGKAEVVPFRAVSRHWITDPVRRNNQLDPEKFRVRAIRQIALAPRSGDVAFGALGRLWRQSNGAQKPQQYSASDASQADIAYSLDGQRAVFVEWRDGVGSSLIVSRGDGSQRRKVAQISGIVREPKFSPDGRSIVYGVAPGDQCLGGHLLDPGIFVMPAAGGASKRISSVGGSPFFSPDGQAVIVTRESYEKDNLLTLLSRIDLKTGEERVLAKTLQTDAGEVRASPDLRWIAFRYQQQYYLAPFNTGEAAIEISPQMPGARQISRLGGYALTWAADSSAVHWLLGPQMLSAAVDGAAPQRAVLDINLDASTDRPTGATAFVGGRILTMDAKDRVFERGTLVVEGNRIVSVGDAAAVSIPKGAHIVNATGRTIMPGFVDMHGHIDICYYASSGLTAQQYASRLADLAFGVTTNYDPYSSELPTYSLREMSLTGAMVGPRAIDSGMVAYGRSGKSDQVYVPIRSYADAQAFMARKAALGGWIVKSYRQPMRSQRQQLIEAGREFGIMTDVEGESHVYNNITMILDGHVNLQHNIPVATYYDDLVQLFAASQSSHTPTLVAMFGELMGENYIYQTRRAWENPKAKRFVSTITSGYSPLATPYGGPLYARNMTTIHAADEVWDIGVKSVARSINKLDKAGALVGVGSHGQVAGFATHWEMELLSLGGMPANRVLRAGTINGARALGVDDQIGSLEVGKLADVVMLENNPLDDIRNTAGVTLTMVNGRLYDANTMNEIGSRPHPRKPLFWEAGRPVPRIEWNKAWAHQ